MVTLFPDIFNWITECGITNQAFKKDLYSLFFWNPRDFANNKYKQVDDRPYGGGPGMVMMAPPLAKCVDAIQDDISTTKQPKKSHIIYLTPQGKPLCQNRVAQLALIPNITLICGRYEGVDERFIDNYVDEEISIGDYVLAGGEIPAMCLIEACIRLLPGALGNTLSAGQDSFTDALLDCPHYTRPEVFMGEPVPSVLLSGHHLEIEQWRKQQAIQRTAERRPDLLLDTPNPNNRKESG